MPKFSENEKAARRYSSDISRELGVPYDLVRAVLDALALHLLEDLRILGEERSPEQLRDTLTIELPNLGSITFHPRKYDSKDSKLTGGWAFKTKLSLMDSFLIPCRESYYEGRDFLTENMMKNFGGIVSDKYRPIILLEEGDNDEQSSS